MKIKAISLIIAYDCGQIVVLNPGDEGEVSDALALDHIEAGSAALADAPELSQLDHDGDGEPGGSIAASGDDLKGLRAEYEALVGKRAFPGWKADKLAELIAAAQGAADEAPVA